MGALGSLAYFQSCLFSSSGFQSPKTILFSHNPFFFLQPFMFLQFHAQISSFPLLARLLTSILFSSRPLNCIIIFIFRRSPSLGRTPSQSRPPSRPHSPFNGGPSYNNGGPSYPPRTPEPSHNEFSSQHMMTSTMRLVTCLR